MRKALVRLEQLQAENTRQRAEVVAAQSAARCLAESRDAAKARAEQAEALNTPLREERVAVVKILLSEGCSCDEEDECRCVQRRALAAMGICGFLRHGSCTKPKDHAGKHDHWHLIPRDDVTTSDSAPILKPAAGDAKGK